MLDTPLPTVLVGSLTTRATESEAYRARTHGSPAALPLGLGLPVLAWQLLFFAAPLAYLVVTDPGFYELAAENAELKIDIATGEVTHVASGRSFKAETPSPIVKALQREGGLVPAINRHGQKVFEALSAA